MQDADKTNEGLNEEQRHLLSVVAAELADKELFHDDEGLLGTMPAEDKLLAAPESEKPAPQAVLSSEPDVLAKAAVIDADRSQRELLKQEEPQDVRQATDGIIGRLRDTGTYKVSREAIKPPKKQVIPTDAIAFAAAFTMLILAMCTVPGLITMAITGKSNLQLQREQEARMCAAEGEDAYTWSTTGKFKNPFEAHLNVSAPAPEPLSAPTGGFESGSDQELAFARDLARRGQTQAAIADYEDFIAHTKDTVVPARIELIKLLLAAGKKRRAQDLCISTLKLQLNKEEFDAIWSLARQSLHF